MIKEVKTADELRQEVESNEIVLLDFYSPTCNPCKFLATQLPEIDAALGSAAILKIDATELTEARDQYKVQGVPTVVILRNGQQLDKFSGFKPADQIVEELRTLGVGI